MVDASKGMLGFSANAAAGPWGFYDRLIKGIPEGIAVRDYCLGMYWSYVEADCGMGVSFTAKGGAKRTCREDLRGKDLRQVAALSKSWCFEEATLGVAALNAYYSQHALLDGMGARYDELVELPDGTIRKIDAFELYRPRMGGANVVVVGHFPHVERIAEYARLTVLERACNAEVDTPDPACEYVIPGCDYLFMTGVTITNKTAPRLLDLARDAHTIFVGPSVVPAPCVFDYGVEMMAGSVVGDPEKARFAVKNAAGKFFGEALQMMSLVRPD